MRVDLPPAGPAPRPLSVLVVSVDTLRADHLSAYGHRRSTSPHLDGLAAGGVLFERAYSQSPKTSPSHMTMMTGLYPASHGVRNASEPGTRSLSEAIPTLATLLRRAGYRTVAFTGGGNVHGELGFSQGFDTFRHVSWPALPFDVAAGALAQLADDARAGRPFFMFLHTYEVHDPYVPPASHAARFTPRGYSGSVLSSREKLFAATPEGGWPSWHRTFWSTVNAKDPRDVQQLRDLYDGSIAYVDEKLGQLLAEAHQLGLDEHLAVLFVSDHGEAFGEHGGFLHETLYQEVLRVPLILRLPPTVFPGLFGRRVSEPVGLIDLAPTVLDVLGLAIPRHYQGESLLPLARGEGRTARPLVAQWQLPGLASLQRGRWKLVRRPRSQALYDVARDVAERHDVSRSEPGLRAQLASELETVLRSQERIASSVTLGPAFEADAELNRQLEALGYIERP